MQIGAVVMAAGVALILSAMFSHNNHTHHLPSGQWVSDGLRPGRSLVGAAAVIIGALMGCL
jgi:hypothetical protein